MSMFRDSISMCRVVFLTVVVLAASADDDMELRKCRRFLHNPGVMQCCKNFSKDFNLKHRLECQDMPRDPTSCDREICIGQKDGYVDADGKLDKTAFEESIIKSFAGQPEVIEAIKTKCIDGDVDEYGAPDYCNLNKLKNCVMVQFIGKCPEWDENGRCKSVKESVDKCSKLMGS